MIIKKIKQTILSTLALLVVCNITAQVKYNAVVAQKLASPASQNELLPLLVKGNIAVIQQLIEPSQGIFKFYAGDIASVEIPVKNIHYFINNSLIERIEGNNVRIQLLNDSVRVNNNVNEVHAGLPPLPQGYDGSGVVIGIIDTGIDFLHPDFRDSIGGQSVTRIKYLWDQTVSSGGTTPLPYNYGQEWNSLMIDSASTHIDASAHGTHVAGVAAGNGKAANINKGVAPASDLIIVEANFNNPTGFMISDAVNYIYAKAQILGKPCVINISLGVYEGSHDGSNMEAQLIKNLITQQNGRSLVAAAGNKGNDPFHLGYNVTSDTSFTWLKPDPQYAGRIYVDVWGDTNDLKNVEIAFGADRISPNYLFKGHTPFKTIIPNLGIFLADTLKSGNDRIGIINSYGDINGGTYQFSFEIIPDSSQFYWRLMTTGTGKIDVWYLYYNISANSRQSGFVYNNIPGPPVLPDSIHYKYPDLSQTMVSSFQCLDEVITVGNYNNRTTHLNCDSNIYVDTTIIAGTLASNSSNGPTRDNRIKPDVTASGDYSMAAGPIALLAAVASGPACNSHLAFGNLHFKEGGTSSASPIIAGIAALYLQRYPNASYADIKNAITNCAKQDAYTGSSLPNSTWGYGKVNAFATLQNCFTGINEKPGYDTEVTVYPNPFQTSTTIKYVINKNNITHTQLVIYNAIGAKVKSIAINNSVGSITLTRNEMPNGIYFYTLTTGKGETLASGKLIAW